MKPRAKKIAKNFHPKVNLPFPSRHRSSNKRSTNHRTNSKNHAQLYRAMIESLIILKRARGAERESAGLFLFQSSEAGSGVMVLDDCETAGGYIIGVARRPLISKPNQITKPNQAKQDQSTSVPTDFFRNTPNP